MFQELILKQKLQEELFQYTNVMLADLSFDGQLRKTLKRHFYACSWPICFSSIINCCLGGLAKKVNAKNHEGKILPS